MIFMYFGLKTSNLRPKNRLKHLLGPDWRAFEVKTTFKQVIATF
jgi:hypothetical protein